MSLVNASRSEVTKQFTSSAWWVLGIVLLAYIGVTAAGLGYVFAASSAGNLPGANAPRLPADAIVPVLYSLASSIGYVFPLLIGTLIVTAEFRHKTLTPTFLATPRRGRVLTAKVVAGILLGAIYAVIALIASVGPSAGVLAGVGIDARLDQSDTWALIGRVALAFVIWVIVGIGVGVLVRNQVAAVVIVLAFTQFVEPIARTVAGLVKGVGDVTRFLPGAASDALVGASVYTTLAAGATDSATKPLEWWVGGAVLLGYGVVFLVVGYFVTWRRDVS